MKIEKKYTLDKESIYVDHSSSPMNKGQATDKIIKMISILILIMLLCTAVSMLFFHIRMFESNIVMIYLLGILSFSYLAEGYIYSLAASVCAVLLYNFFFTEPYYNLKVNNPDYIITFFVMFIVGFITSMLTIKVKKERQQVEDREQYISSLYIIGKKLLDVKNEEDLVRISAQEISQRFDADVMIQLYNESGEIIGRYIKGEDSFDGELDRSACLEVYQSGSPCGHGTILFGEAKAYYQPIMSMSGVLGVLGIALSGTGNILHTQVAFIEVIIAQIVVIMERQKLNENQKKVQLEMHKERLRADMLRSISHDFRTPLAGIMGLASTAKDNYDKISDEVRKNFLQSIYDDADWLNELVENILQTTRFEEGRTKLNLDEEAAEEIITAAITHVNKHAGNHFVYAVIPDEIILIKVDAILIRQVIVNLLNNAINYSPSGSEIVVSLYRDGNKVIFEVRDNGPGILRDELDYVFERYHHNRTSKETYRKGMGLGLSLCKSIIEAHGGKIAVSNNEPHGTIVKFYIFTE
ncbi:MAG: integral rane sensor signal transduction histidine kinase [Herbinix sp.]|nr:integral rane sensor signal transduction histidine kinase [Herbinix sp.]